MKKAFFLFLLNAQLLLWHTNYIFAESADTLQHVRLEEIVVSANRAGINTPVAYKNIKQNDLKQQNTAQNIPGILQTTPSLVSFSEDGTGVGNTSLRIRGTDATRINVTLDGLPLNNPESQEVYWVNLPNLASSLQNIQIQRGVGTSTNGSAAFGASISMKTSGARSQPYGEASTALGSYNTFSSTIAAGTGITNHGFSADVRYSRNIGDGYIRNGFVNHKNFHTSLSYYRDHELLKFSYIKAYQQTGITWVGIEPDEMEKYGRKYNSAGQYKDEMGNIHYYDNETDNYHSNILQLIYLNELNSSLSLNANLNYNKGSGYYENYRYNRKYSDFGLPSQIVNGIEYKRTDFIRQKKMANNFYVANVSLNYKKNKLEGTFGTMYSFFDGDHFGVIPWVKHNQNIENNYEWYRNKGEKEEFNVFGKVSYMLNPYFSFYGDLQYRHINYKLNGRDDDLVSLDGNFNYNFFNPKMGLFYNVTLHHKFYGSIAVAHREPLRSDLKDGIKKGGNNAPKPEMMIDYEFGYQINNNRNFYLGINLYHMNYRNQLVQTGKLNDTGYKLMENVANSYRQGIELESYIATLENKLRFDFNATFSRNRIKNYTAYYDRFDNPKDYTDLGQKTQNFQNTHISFSPDFIGMTGLTYQPVKSLYLNIHNKYVSKQYLDNTTNDEKSIKGYNVSNISIGYSFDKIGLGKINVQFFVNNIFNNEYIANGWASTTYFESDGYVNYIGYYPQATRNYMLRLTIGF